MNKTHIGKTHIFSDYGTSTAITLKAGAGSTLNLSGAVNIVTDGSNEAGLSFNGVPIVSAHGNLNDLTDTLIVSPLSGQIITYTNSLWKNITPVTQVTALTALSDILISAVTTGQILTYTGGFWKNISPVTQATALTALSDALISAVTTGQILTYTGGFWKNISPVTIGISSLSDTLISAVTSGQILTYTDGSWKNITPVTTATSLNALTDTNIVTPITNDILWYSGAKWRNVPSSTYTSSILASTAIHHVPIETIITNSGGSSWTTSRAGTAYANGICWSEYNSNYVMVADYSATNTLPTIIPSTDFVLAGGWNSICYSGTKCI
mgnify:FL=1